MPRIAFLVSSAREIALRDDPRHPTGYWAEEALTAYERFAEAGAEVVVMTPDGAAPTIDPYSLEPVFNYPDEDRDYAASIYRTFRRNENDIRITLHHATRLDLVASRRIARRLVMGGTTKAEAHALVSRAARIAWEGDRRLLDVMSNDGLSGGLADAELVRAAVELDTVARALAADREGCLDAIDGFRSPLPLEELADDQLARYDAVFVPGGHASMVDLPESRHVSRLLSVAHDRDVPVATLCHGPAALLAAPERWDGQWLYEGYRLTAFTNEEEDQNDIGRRGMPWYLASALQNAGAVLDEAPAPWASHVVVDRRLITGQNPYSSRATADALLRALGLGEVNRAR